MIPASIRARLDDVAALEGRGDHDPDDWTGPTGV
jgi:hypothetical protein